jgi:hypothetical protein
MKKTEKNSFMEITGKTIKINFPVCPECGYRHYKKAGMHCQFEGGL